MIKLVIFDLDGVLVSTKEMHFTSLNDALEQRYKITLEEHYDRYDGLPTLRKLQMLTKEKGLPENLYEQISKNKQQYTFNFIRNCISEDNRLIEVLKLLKQQGLKIHVASNSIRETVKLLLFYTGLIEYVDYYISNEDVKYSKPHSEMYLQCMIMAGVNIDETLIIEDSPRGIEGALRSKAQVLIVENPNHVTFELIMDKINGLASGQINKTKLSLDLNIIIPMAGAGSRFSKAGYTFPKPLIEVNGKPMIQVVVDNIGIEANYIYIVRSEDYLKYHLKGFLNLLTPNCTIIQVDSLTEGAACTTLLAKEFINNDKPLIIANSDQYVEWNTADFYYKMIETKADGGIVTFTASHPKWSYVKTDEQGNVIEVAEKVVISNEATVGIYYFKHGWEYVKYAEQMIEKNIRTNGEFYLCPVYNEFIGDGKKIKTFHVDKNWGLGNPEDLDYFINNYK